jgi:hypothetical protein
MNAECVEPGNGLSRCSYLGTVALWRPRVVTFMDKKRCRSDRVIRMTPKQ